MYRLNPLNRFVLITSDEVISKSATDGVPDARGLQAAIEIAEERFIVPVLGYDLYEYFTEQKNREITADNIATIQAEISGAGITTTLKVGQIVNAIEFVTDEWLKKLWNRYLWKVIAECVAYTHIPTNAIRSTSKGEMQNNPTSPIGGQESASVGLHTLKFKMDKSLMDRIDPLLEAMRVWLCKYKENFTKWDSSGCDCGESGTRKMSGWVFGVYDDEPNCGCNNDEI